MSDETLAHMSVAEPNTLGVAFVGSDLRATVAAGSGDIVMLLDPADELLPTACAVVKRAFADDRRVVHVQWPRVVRKADGSERIEPDGLLSTGDLMPRIRAGGLETCVFAGRSGHAFRRDFLEAALPLVAATDESAHLTLALMAVAAGRVLALYEPQAIGPDEGAPADVNLFSAARSESRVLEQRLDAAAAFWRRSGTQLPIEHLRSTSTPHRLVRALEHIERAIPFGTPFAIVDDHLWLATLQQRGHAVEPFPEHDGEYWGPPSDDAEAQTALASMTLRGVRHLVVGWPSFWWFDAYPGWAALLADRSDVVLRTAESVIFVLDHGRMPVRESMRPATAEASAVDSALRLSVEGAEDSTERLITGLADAYLARLAACASSRVSCALVDFPDHTNVGDSAIWLGERLALQRAGFETAYICTMLNYDADALRSAVGDGPIFLHGGGNFGDLYPAHQRFRERVTGDFPGNRIVQLPQTVNFKRRVNAERARSVVNAHGDFILLVRDRTSHQVASMLFDRPAELCPDAAFVIGRLSRPTPATLPVLWLARTDFESGVRPIDVGGTLHTVDWLTRDETCCPDDADWSFLWPEDVPITPWDEQALRHLQRGARMLAQSQVIITDRLHGHILSLLLCIPHVLLNDAFSKVYDFHDVWTADSDLVRRADGCEEALHLSRLLVGPPASRPGSVST